jgi:hypothetical protein
LNTPAPDIIHEGAGHAPIIANQNMRNTSSFGEWLQSNFFAQRLRNVRAIRLLSIVKKPKRHLKLRLMLLKKVEDFCKMYGRTLRNGSNTQLTGGRLNTGLMGRLKILKYMVLVCFPL